jgi:anti-sigma B factor antagonist
VNDDPARDAGISEMRIEVGGDPRWPRVRVCGELDLASAPMLRDELQRLIDLDAQDIILDLRDVAFVDSSGLGVLVGVYNRLRDSSGGQVTIEGAQDRVRKVFEITGLGPLFGLTADA